jgi:hypothetical protein
VGVSLLLLGIPAAAIGLVAVVVVVVVGLAYRSRGGK